jgi:hypothetical protein
MVFFINSQSSHSQGRSNDSTTQRYVSILHARRTSVLA